MNFLENKNHIYFRVDFGGLIGRGHLSRCLSLATVFKNHGYEPIFISRRRPCNANDTLPFKLVWLSKGPDASSTDVESWKIGSIGSEIDEVLKILEDESVVVLDHYALDSRWQKSVRAKGHKIILIQDFYNENFEVDALVNYNLLAPSLYSSEFIKKKSALFLLGSEYAPLNLKYREEHNLRFDPNENVKNVGIYLGGVETSILEKLAKAISKITFFETKNIDWVVGSKEHEKFLENTLSIQNLRVHVRLDTLIPLYNNVQLFIGACGVSFLERACMGLWQINFMVAENQKEIAAGAGQVFDIKSGNERQLIDFLNTCLMINVDDNLKSIKSYFNKVDGQGAENIYKSLSAYGSRS